MTPRPAARPDPANEPLEIPLRWKLHAHLPTLGGALAKGELRWPHAGPPLLVVERVDASRAAWVGDPPELAFVEVDDPDELLALAALADRDGGALLAFAGPSIPAAAVASAAGQAPWSTVLRRGPSRASALVDEASRATAELVRRLAYRTLLAGWKAESARHLAALDRLAFSLPPGVPPQRRAASLSMLADAHVAALCGLWWRCTKVAQELGIAPATVRRARARLPPGLAGVLARATCTRYGVLVVEGDHDVAAAMAGFTDRALADTGSVADVALVSTAAEARRHVETSQVPPAIAWIDAGPADSDAGAELVSWLRQRSPTVVLARSAAAPDGFVRELARRGALGTWVAESSCAGGDAAARALASRAAVAARHVRGATEALRLVELLEHDLLAYRDPEVGRAGLTVEELERAVVRRVLAEHGGNRSEAADALGIDRKRVRRIVGA